MADWKNILSESEEQLTDEELLKYLENDIAEEEKYSIEEKINNSPFEADALQGLQQLQNKDLQKHVKQLNQKLQQITGRRQKKEKKRIKMWQWIILAVILLLFICLVGYFIIALQHKSLLHAQVISRPLSILLLS